YHPSYVLGCHLLSPAFLSSCFVSFGFAHPVLPRSSGEGQDGLAWADCSLTPHPIPPHVGGGDRCVLSWPRFCTCRPYRSSLSVPLHWTATTPACPLPTPPL